MTTKHVLREAMRDWLPTEILSRKKMGFPVPVGAWLRGAYRPVLDEFVTSPRALGRGFFAPDEVRRLVASHVVNPSPTLDLTDPVQAHEVVTTFVLPGLDPAA